MKTIALIVLVIFLIDLLFGKVPWSSDDDDAKYQTYRR